MIHKGVQKKATGQVDASGALKRPLTTGMYISGERNLPWPKMAILTPTSEKQSYQRLETSQVVEQLSKNCEIGSLMFCQCVLEQGT